MSAELKPISKYIRGRTTTPTSGRTTTPTFAIKPAEVIFDNRLNFTDRHIYDVIVYFRDGDEVESGERWLAGAAGVDRRTYRNSRDKLVKCGYLKREESTGKVSRAKYRLLSVVFKGKVVDMVNLAIGVEMEPVAEVKTASTSTPQKPMKKLCPECRKFRYGKMLVGWCRSCNSRKNNEKLARRIAREEIAAARQEKTA